MGRVANEQRDSEKTCMKATRCQISLMADELIYEENDRVLENVVAVKKEKT